ncbi:unnamed protein product, partial [Ascophyllum nodosum]
NITPHTPPAVIVSNIVKIVAFGIICCIGIVSAPPITVFNTLMSSPPPRIDLLNAEKLDETQLSVNNIVARIDFLSNGPWARCILFPTKSSCFQKEHCLL